MLDVTRIERADGQPLGLGAEFEEYWREYSEGFNDTAREMKSAAFDAFVFARKNQK